MSCTVAETALYVYGVIAAGDERRLPDDASVDLVGEGELAAITRSVSLDEFGEDALRANLNDRDWLEANARRHEDVLLAVAAAVDVVPFRFGTICRSEDDVRALLAEQSEVLAVGLERIRGRVEIGAKLWVDLGRFEATLTPVGGAGAEGSGRAYLESRKREQDRSAKVQALCREVARGVYERLLGYAVEGVVNRPQPRELTQRDEEMLLNAAFLVPAGETAIAGEIDRIHSELRNLGFSLELTGPWPAHNFVEPAEVER